jgi:predicted O-methyltransferase YrrM
MDEAVKKVLHEFELRSEKEWNELEHMDARTMLRRRDEFLLSVGPATGELISLLVKEARSKTIVEVGSSYGYSTVVLAEAARETGGRVISLEIVPEKQKNARASVEKAGVKDFVDFRLGDARESIEKLETAVDFVLLDLWKDLYIPCFDLLYPKLTPGAFIAADNMLYPESVRNDAEAYRRHIRTRPDIQSVLLPVGSGIELTRYK